LFWSCGHCNNVKNQKKYQKGILDCCKTDPEEHIYFRLIDDEVSVAARQESDSFSGLTAELVNEVFNMKNTGMRVCKSDSRLKKLNFEMNVLYDYLEEIRKTPNSKVTLRKLKALLRRETAFAAFKRCYVREHIKEYPQLEQYIT